MPTQEDSARVQKACQSDGQKKVDLECVAKELGFYTAEGHFMPNAFNDYFIQRVTDDGENGLISATEQQKIMHRLNNKCGKKLKSEAKNMLKVLKCSAKVKTCREPLEEEEEANEGTIGK